MSQHVPPRPCPARAAVRQLLGQLCTDDSREARARRLIAAAEATGGTYLPADPGSTWGPHLHQLTLYGVSATGEDLPELERNWRRAATASYNLSLRILHIGEIEALSRLMRNPDREDAIRADACRVLIDAPNVAEDLRRRAEDLLALILGEQEGAAA